MNFAKRGLAVLLALMLVMSVAGGSVLAANDQEQSGDQQQTTTETVAKKNGKKKSGTFTKYKYSDYMKDMADKPYATTSFTVAANTFDAAASSADVKVDTRYDADKNFPKTGIKGATVYTGEESTVVWNINVPQSGLYAIHVDYRTEEGRNSDAERAMTIDNKEPFTEANALAFPRVWKDAGDIRKDISGNDVRPESKEVFGWYAVDCRDTSGNYGERMYFYFSKGAHKISFRSEREALLINNLHFYVPEKTISYEEYLKEHSFDTAPKPTAASTKEGEVSVKVQAEKPYLKSSTTLYAEYDRTTPAMEPYSYDLIALNEINGEKFTSPYQWLSWKVNVKEAGFYKIVTRFQQTSKDGSFCNRTLYINGEVPCEEAKHIRFDYDSGWQVKALSSDPNKDMYFYLNKGENEIKLEVTLGDFADILDRVDTIVYTLNECYRDILLITGSTPDAYRDYFFKDLIPDTLDTMAKSSEDIKGVVADIEKLVGDSGSFTSSFKTLTQDIDTMTENPPVPLPVALKP